MHQFYDLVVVGRDASCDALLQRLEAGQGLLLGEDRQQEREQFEGGADVGDVGVGSLNAREDLVEDDEFQVDRVRPQLRFERCLQQEDATAGQHLSWAVHYWIGGIHRSRFVDLENNEFLYYWAGFNTRHATNTKEKINF